MLPKKTHDHGYHIDFELCDRSRDLLGISCPLALALGTGELVRARYMCVSLVLPVTVVTLGIGLCEGVDRDSSYGHEESHLIHDTEHFI